jgi:large subunit ribosomal protein L7e
VQAIEVPETLLKKRKQNEKAREERLAAAAAARKVRSSPHRNLHQDVYDSFDENG